MTWSTPGIDDVEFVETLKVLEVSGHDGHVVNQGSRADEGIAERCGIRYVQGNLTVSLLAGLVPIPGGVGVTEGGLIFGLTSFGVPQEVAFAAVMLYRLSTFYTPPIWGFFSLRWLERNRYL